MLFGNPQRRLIPNRVQDEPNSLVLWASGFVARSLQTALGMRLARASSEARNPARLSLILTAHWNKQENKARTGCDNFNKTGAGAAGLLAGQVVVLR